MHIQRQRDTFSWRFAAVNQDFLDNLYNNFKRVVRNLQKTSPVSTHRGLEGNDEDFDDEIEYADLSNKQLSKPNVGAFPEERYIHLTMDKDNHKPESPVFLDKSRTYVDRKGEEHRYYSPHEINPIPRSPLTGESFYRFPYTWDEEKEKWVGDPNEERGRPKWTGHGWIDPETGRGVAPYDPERENGLQRESLGLDYTGPENCELCRMVAPQYKEQAHARHDSTPRRYFAPIFRSTYVNVDDFLAGKPSRTPEMGNNDVSLSKDEPSGGDQLPLGFPVERNPSFRSRDSIWEHPDLGRMLLDHIALPKDPVRGGGLGRHYTTDPEIARQLVPPVPEHMRDQHNYVPVIMRGMWGGRGENPDMPGTGYSLDEKGNKIPWQEDEVNLIPQAQFIPTHVYTIPPGETEFRNVLSLPDQHQIREAQHTLSQASHITASYRTAMPADYLWRGINIHHPGDDYTGDSILDHIRQEGQRRGTGMGRHWTTMPDYADGYAEFGEETDDYDAGGPDRLQVRMKATPPSDGSGVDPDRTGTGEMPGHHYDDDDDDPWTNSEVTMLPSAQMTIHDVQARRPGESQWRSLPFRHAHRTAMPYHASPHEFNQEFPDNYPKITEIGKQFDDWAEATGAKNPRDEMLLENGASPTNVWIRGPIGHWPNVENFVKDNYPEAYRGFEYGREEAQPLLDAWDGKETKAPHYETGFDAIEKYGYDPKEIIAIMVLLHNQSHPGRKDDDFIDQRRLNDIAQKRYQMQRDYEQRQQNTASCHRIAMPHDEDDYDELYHFTDDPHFAGPRPDHEPATISEFTEPGIYLTNDPHNSSVSGGGRPYMATFRVPSWYQDHPGFEPDHYGNSSDYFVRPEWFHELKLTGVSPSPVHPHTAHRTAMPTYYAQHPDYNIIRFAGNDERYWGNGGCAALALAMKNHSPHMKIGVEWDRGTPELQTKDSPHHVWTYDEEKNISHDWRGYHQGIATPAPGNRHGEVELDVDPERVARSMNMEWTPDDPWADDDVNEAARQFLGY